jgi:hypothetical protein
LLAIGVLAVVDLAGASVPPSAYVAVALATVGAGLVAGAWYGRARWLIALGAVLTVALGITSAGDRWDDRPNQNVTWAPASVADLRSPYRVEGGNGVLDLSKVEFSDSQPTRVEVASNLGNLEIILPPRVDVDVTAGVNFGNAQVFEDQWGGVGRQERIVHNNGIDGPGGGQLFMTADVRFGNLEVHR